ncbi:MAG: hypothetical protein Q8O67_01085 [Deltaproteobacteria bacterium]|nr:hypothetical protein [Deltaproteobacteria bacterium]
MLAFAFVLAAAAPTLDDAHVLTELIASAAAQRVGVDVLTSEDVRRAVDLEANRQSLGCAASSCLAEIASAMGARIVLYGSVSKLGDDEQIVTLNLFDSGTATSSGRASLRGADLKALVAQIDGVVGPLVDKALAGAPSTTKTRLLVLDVELRAPATAAAVIPAPPPEPPLRWMMWAGVGAAALGAAGVVVGGVYDANAAAADARGRDVKTLQVNAVAAFDERDQSALIAGLGYVVGGVLIAGGAVLTVVGVQE